MQPSRFLAAALILLLAGCATTLPLTMPVGAVPDLRGAWTGTWGATPLTLFVLQQEPAGRDLPGLSGILTFTVAGEATSVHVRGRLGDSNGRLALVLEPLTVNGEQITLTHVDERRLAGAGTSRPGWEPQGPVELVRQTR